MKVITVWQPWASLLACGAKRYETRGWATNYRGPIAIHAGKQEWYLAFFQGNRPLQDAVIRAFGGTPDHGRGSAKGGNFDLPYSAIIATAELVYCHMIHGRFSDGHPCLHITTLEADMAEIPITGDEILFGDWTPGRYAWELANVKMLPEPINAKGRQGIWNWEGA